MLTEKEQAAVQSVISRGHNSGQSETVAVADWMEGVYGEEDMELEILISGLEELEASAKFMRVELLKTLGSKTCRKCGSTIHENGRCSDLTCPFNDRPQDATYTEG